MLMSMNVFQQTTPKLLSFPSVSCHGRRRIPPHSSSHVLFSSPATTMEFNFKFLNINSSCEPVLASTMKFCQVLFALPRDDEEVSSGNDEDTIIQEHLTSTPSDNNANIEQLKKMSGGEVKKLEFLVREATEGEFYASAALKASGLYRYDQYKQDDCYIDIYKLKNVEEEFDIIWTGYWRRASEPFVCIIAIRKEDENNKVVGTLNFTVKQQVDGETNPDQEVVSAKMIKTFKQSESLKYGIVSNLAVARIARQQGVGSSMLKFVTEFAKESGIKQIFLQVHRENKPALALFRKMGFTISAKATPLQEQPNMYTCCINL
ncbi:hypothetical protein MKW94_017103 [Papaver nudicaule]|uniref:N-acetyltransferase domain-containing protein n=1 Tax=Papaver nudicaule TaxID=74823 RepID=A0AA41UV77_PAPNU|nr:hypothetical protein [Papaver nudicaule]